MRVAPQSMQGRVYPPTKSSSPSQVSLPNISTLLYLISPHTCTWHLHTHIPMYIIKSEQLFQKRVFNRETLLIYYFLVHVFVLENLRWKWKHLHVGMVCNVCTFTCTLQKQIPLCSKVGTSFHVLNRGRTREVYSRDVRGTIQNWTTISDSAGVSRCLQQYHKTCLYIHTYHSGQVGIVHQCIFHRR